MFDMTDSIVAAQDRGIAATELYRRAHILDQFHRTPDQEEEIREILGQQIQGIGISTESLFDFLSEKLIGLFGKKEEEIPAPEMKQLYRSVSQFADEIQKTFANEKWINTRQVKEGNISIGADTREWMWGEEVVSTVEQYLPGILSGLKKDCEKQWPLAKTYLLKLRSLEQGLYDKSPEDAYNACKQFMKAIPLPECPAPYQGPYLGNYKVNRVGGWWSIDLHPKFPELPRSIPALHHDQLLSMGKSMVQLLVWSTDLHNMETRFDIWMDSRKNIYDDPRRKNWWDHTSAMLGKEKAAEMFSLFDKEEVFPRLTGLTRYYSGYAWRYAKAFYERMSKSLK